MSYSWLHACFTDQRTIAPLPEHFPYERFIRPQLRGERIDLAKLGYLREVYRNPYTPSDVQAAIRCAMLRRGLDIPLMWKGSR